MSPLPFRSSTPLTLGVELEIQLLDADTFDLTPGAPRLFSSLGGEHPGIRPEIFQSMLEIRSGIYDSLPGLRADLESILKTLRGIKPDWMEFASAGSHPFARYLDRVISPAEEYRHLLERNQWAVRRAIIFGLHIHVGMRDGDHAAEMISALTPYLPYLLALSASSPFWQGVDTGLASSRITVFEALPNAGHAPTYRSWSEFESLYDSLVASRSISSIHDLWWDIRPQPEYGTMEIRICDALPTLSENLAVVALVQALVHRLDEEQRAGHRPEPPADWLVRENKWRASRHGIEAEVILDARGRTARLRKELEGLIASLRPRAAALGAPHAFATLERMLAGGCSYERQRRVYRRTGSMPAVAEALAREFRTNRPVI